MAEESIHIMEQERYPCLAVDTMFALSVLFTKTISGRTSDEATIFSLPIINTRYNSRIRPETHTSNNFGQSAPLSRDLSSYSSVNVGECGCTHGRLLYRTDSQGPVQMKFPACHYQQYPVYLKFLDRGDITAI